MAKDFGRTDYWAPESDLDSIAPGVNYTLPSGTVLNVQVNDWLDIDSTGLPEDQFWGSSHQVIELGESEITVRVYNSDLDLFEPQAISPDWILNNYRRVPNG